jgi:hypothetical protein
MDQRQEDDGSPTAVEILRAANTVFIMKNPNRERLGFVFGGDGGSLQSPPNQYYVID